MNTKRIGGFTVYSVEFTHCDSGVECRIPCCDAQHATEIAESLFDVHYSVRVVKGVSK